MPTSLPIRAYFGDRVISAGFIAVPHLLRRHYRAIGLEEETLVFVLHLLAMIWDTADPPRNLGDIASSMGKSVNTVRRYSSAINQLGLVVIHERFRGGQQIGNDYDLSPLWERLASFAPAALDAGVEVGRRIVPTTEHKAEHMFRSRSKMKGSAAQRRAPHPYGNDTPAPAKPTAPGHTEMPAFNKKEEDRRIEEEAAAATLGTIISIAQARRLVVTYPACLPHAGALVAEARQGKRPAGLLIHLIERGWTPPAAAGGPDAPEREACPGCGGDVALCHGIHGRIAYDEVEQGNDDDRR